MEKWDWVRLNKYLALNTSNFTYALVFQYFRQILSIASNKKSFLPLIITKRGRNDFYYIFINCSNWQSISYFLQYSKVRSIILIFTLQMKTPSALIFSMVIVKKGDFGSVKWLAAGNCKLFEHMRKPGAVYPATYLV